MAAPESKMTKVTCSRVNYLVYLLHAKNKKNTRLIRYELSTQFKLTFPPEAHREPSGEIAVQKIALVCPSKVVRVLQVTRFQTCKRKMVNNQTLTLSSNSRCTAIHFPLFQNSIL